MKYLCLALSLTGCIADPQPTLDGDDARVPDAAVDAAADAAPNIERVEDAAPPDATPADAAAPDATPPDAAPGCDDPEWRIVATAELAGAPHDLDLRDGILYGVLPAEGLAIIDVVDPLSPVALGVQSVPGAQAFAIHPARSWGVVAAVGDGVRVLDLSQPASPREIGAFDLVGAAGAEYAQDLLLIDETAYVAAGSQGVWRVDVAEPRRPRGAGSCCGEGGHPLSGPRGVAAIDGGLLVADTEAGLVAVTLQDGRLTQASVHPLPAEAQAVEALADAAYVLLADGRVARFAQDGVDAVERTQIIELPARATHLAALEDELFIGTTDGVWTLADGDATQVLAVDGGVTSLLMADRRLYIGGAQGLQVAELDCP